jgi:tetratricopeptide (TPR) repeat protein
MKLARFQPVMLAVTASMVACALLEAAPGNAQEAAQSDEAVQARALFGEARKLAQSGDYRQACPKFEESLRLNVGIGTQFNLADCWEHIGRTASARALFLGAAASAHAAGQPEREQVAKARADALEPRLLRLLIDVRATDAELLVRRNQIAVNRDDWGVAAPVDAGVYLIEASAPGKKVWSARVSVPSNASEAISVIVPPLEDAAVSCEPKPALEAPTGGPPSPAADAPAAPVVASPSHHTAYALSLAGLGLASVTVGTVLALEYKSKNDDAIAICPSGVGCSAGDIDRHSGLVSDAKTFRTWSFVGFGVGGAALIGAAVWYFVPNSPTQRASGFVAAPFASADGTWGAVASGRF